MTVSRAAALAWRLRRHHLAGPAASSVEEVVGRLLAVPSWLGDAGAAIGLRLGDRSAAHDALRAALVDGRVVTTYAHRGSTQVMTPGGAAVHLALRLAGRQWERASWRSHYGLEPGDWPRLRAVVRDAVADRPLTQAELAEAVTRDPAYAHLGEAFTHRSHTFLKPFGWHGDVRIDTSDGTFRLASTADVPGWTGPLPLEEAGPLAVRAYLATYGPATRERVDHWLVDGLSAGRRRVDGWVEALQADGTVVTLDVEGEPASCLAGDAGAIAAAEPSDEVVLVPGHDPWVLGPGTADPWIVPPGHRVHATRGAALALRGGRVVGTWRQGTDGPVVDWFP
ncbi:DNA glycosylase AlkZ-like family protein [Nocardioides sp. CFH 31398]|uniref:DNA glycosylase AlkZ-like family protein n=1 Tax=Nocardioides sp. CFH 31398 TaxID=2919579 RepID=UPI001F054B82|nr:crosslink repair DNA glycosylase YcaQ family protein [Nocardioides sp. CFH 31398]MCH1865793.1 winged helix DNA-binding domain-containing protein [Nocardioides sp. CFH 31398]